jgi:hypothetical protein
MSTKSTKAKETKRWYQYSLRALLLVVTLFAFLCSWLGVKIHQAKKQRKAVEALQKLGAGVLYDYQLDAYVQNNPIPQQPAHPWLKNLLGEDLFLSVDYIGVPKNFNDDGLQYLDAIPNIETISFSESQITDAGLDRIKHLDRLSSLNLNYCGISDKGLQNLKTLTQLQILYLYDTQITDAGLENLKELKNLRELYLSSTQVSDAGLKHLTGLSKLQYLFLNKCKISDSGLKSLEGLKRLEILELRDTSVSKKGVMDLQRALPECGISFGSEK